VTLGRIPEPSKRFHSIKLRYLRSIANGTDHTRPAAARDPVTFRAHVAAYQTPWPKQPTPQLVLYHAALQGFSGSPVFLADRKVIAILVADGSPDWPGTSVARPVSVFREMLEERSHRERLSYG